MDLSDYPRAALGVWPTPLLRARRLEEHVRRDIPHATAPFFVKRDDLSGFALAGNKTRQLEYLLGGALADGCDTIVVGGQATSNFCQGAAVAARIAGLECHIVLPGHPPAPPSVNLAIALDCGAQVTFSGGPREQLDEEIRNRAAALTSAGRRAMPIPRGGSTPLGSFGFVQAAAELCHQLRESECERARIVLPVGSGGTVAGLVAGLSGQDLEWVVHGISVSRPLNAMRDHISELVAACAKLAGIHQPDLAALRLVQAPGELHGSGHVAGEQEREAALLALRTEGLILDPEYTARAFPFAVRLLAEGDWPVVFWHTGGWPAALSEYAFAENARTHADFVKGAR